MPIKTRRIVSLLGVLAALSVLGASSASADVSATDEGALTTGQDCSKGCTECQKDCHESRCMTSCTMQWSGCCMTAGLKPPAAGSCACSTN